MSANIHLARESDAAAIAAIYAPFCLDAATTFENEPPDANEMWRRITITLERYPWLVYDEQIRIPHSSIFRGDARALAESHDLRNLLNFNLTGCSMGAGVVELASSPNLAQLAHLELCQVALSKQAIRALAESPYLNRLCTLEVDDLGDLSPLIDRFGEDVVRVH